MGHAHLPLVAPRAATGHVPRSGRRAAGGTTGILGPKCAQKREQGVGAGMACVDWAVVWEKKRMLWPDEVLIPPSLPGTSRRPWRPHLIP
jgi:hypothetical protein